MKVSIITVVYNNEKTLAQAIDSVLMQNYPNIEYIVIDGASKDGTIALINAYGDKIDQFISETDDGLYDAMNKGLKIAQGDIVGILNSDDFYTDKTVISRVVDGFQRTLCDVLYADVNYVKNIASDEIVRKWVSHEYKKNYFEKGFVPAHPSVFIKANLVSKYQYNLNYKLAADYDWLLRIFKNRALNIHYEPFAIINMRLGGATSKNWKNILRGNLEIAQSWWKNEKKIPILTLFYFRPKVKLKQFV
ncbi:MAG: glycosyltransferase involved in cell wall biosynthesis [Salibacteraceae bacterium]|jgi:glycosyltransferase involved in cell wall biosynthesis